ncbi:MAG: energy transducer TonB [Salibacteraceae bacterium]
MKTFYLLFFWVAGVSNLGLAQTNTSPDTTSTAPNDAIFVITETQPRFPGGEAEMYKFLGQNMKYPPKARDKNVQGRVYISFVVEKDGSISDVKCIRGIGGGCDEEAIRVVKSMPIWTPGEQDGKIVRVRYNLPIVFKLQGTGTKSKKQRKEEKARKKEEEKRLRSSSTFEEF